ncbi:MAG TPA: phenylalanine--tRNA ligase subunit alpha, partial [Peptococcaceae bacterium]|nr:phenylalanine--tRNA ligase subunit alpha [Peptococcaceae bacterium]
MEQEIQRIKDSALADLQDVETEEELQELRVKYLGKKG